MASGLLPKSPVSSSLCDEVPHIFIPKSHLEPGEFLISSAKRLLQQYRHIADIPTAPAFVRYWRSKADMLYGVTISSLRAPAPAKVNDDPIFSYSSHARARDPTVSAVTSRRHKVLFNDLCPIRNVPPRLIETGVDDFLSCCRLGWHYFSDFEQSTNTALRLNFIFKLTLMIYLRGGRACVLESRRNIRSRLYCRSRKHRRSLWS
jgi:hypothetical protein